MSEETVVPPSTVTAAVVSPGSAVDSPRLHATPRAMGRRTSSFQEARTSGEEEGDIGG